MIEFKKLSRHTGAEIMGVDLSKPIPRATVDEIMALFHEHCVIVFRGQSLDPDGLVAATNMFGKAAVLSLPKEVVSARQQTLPPQIMMITNIREDGKTIGAHPDGEMWFHHDTIHRKVPHMATLLYSVEIPSWGGNTAFSNLFAAYDGLPADLKQALEGRKAYNAFSYGSTRKNDPNAVAARSHAIHPAIRTHEETGRKAIFVDRLMTQSLVDVPEKEGEAILERVFDFIEREEFVYEHVWRVGDVAARYGWGVEPVRWIGRLQRPERLCWLFGQWRGRSGVGFPLG